MKSIVRLCLVAALLVLGPAMAVSAPQASPDDNQRRFRVGFFWEGFQIKDKNLTDFYGHYQKNMPGFEASVHTKYNIDAWVAYRVYSEEAKTTFYGFVSKFRMGMFSLGALYRYPIGIFEPFVGAGFEFYSYSEKIEETQDLAGESGGAFGLHAQLGCYVNITKFLAAKLFFRLSGVNETLDNPLPDYTTLMQLGGQEFGLSLVARF